MPLLHGLFFESFTAFVARLREDVFTSEIVTPKSPAAVNNGFVALSCRSRHLRVHLLYLITLQLQLKDYQHLCNDF